MGNESRQQLSLCFRYVLPVCVRVYLCHKLIIVTETPNVLFLLY